MFGDLPQSKDLVNANPAGIETNLILTQTPLTCIRLSVVENIYEQFGYMTY